jgi:hypothetical protein
MLAGRELSFMRSSNIFAGFFVSVAFLLSGCDDIKDKLGMSEKKETASKEDSKDKKEKKKAADDEEEQPPPRRAQLRLHRPLRSAPPVKPLPTFPPTATRS